MNIIRFNKLHWFLLGPYSTKNNKAERLESGAERGIQGPIHPLISYRATINAKQERADHFTQMGLSHETDS